MRDLIKELTLHSMKVLQQQDYYQIEDVMMKMFLLHLILLIVWMMT